MKRVNLLILLLLSLLSSSIWSQEKVTIHFEPEGGQYLDEVEVNMLCDGCTIYYTTDGSSPSKNSARYRKPIFIKKNTVIRAVAIKGNEKSDVMGQSYLLDEPISSFPIISIGASPAQLFDMDKGLFMKGTQVIDSLWNKPGANFWSKKEITAQIDIFEDDGQLVFSGNTGLRLFGGMSRLFPQKSLTIVARDRFGPRRIKHPIFGKDHPDKFKFLVLRNSGSDFGKSQFRDALMTSLVKDWDLNVQAYRPAHVYINGKYWGIYNIREKINRYFIQQHSEADKDSIDLLEHRITRKRGSKLGWMAFLEYLKNNDISKPENYAYVKSKIEIDNFIDHQIAQIFFDNIDAGGNIRYWRPQTEDGKWRWILYDTDWGFGLHDSHAYDNNSLNFHTEAHGPHWPNPPWSTFLLRKLLTNEEFKHDFTRRFCDRLNGSLRKDYVLKQIDHFYTQLAPEIPLHHKRWRLKEGIWLEHIERMKTFAEKRPAYVFQHLQEYFHIEARRQVQLSATSGGAVILNNNIEIRNEIFEGTYFSDDELELKALANYGNRFLFWESSEGEKLYDRVITLLPSVQDIQYTAVFEPYKHPLAGTVVINEVCPINKKSGDWVEIFNSSKNSIHIRNWVLTDLKNEFIIEDATIGPNNYLVICKDSAGFFKQNPSAYNVLPHLNFGINKHKESLSLFASNGAIIDSIGYQVPPTDSSFTLSLLLPHLENANPENWQLRFGQGTPNGPNPYYVESRIRHRQQQWIQIGMAAAIILLSLIILHLRHRDIL